MSAPETLVIEQAVARLSEADRALFVAAREYPSGVWLGGRCSHLYGDGLCRMTGELTDLGLAVRVACLASPPSNSPTAGDALLTKAAARIVDYWMGDNIDWRAKLHDSDFLESADWLTAVELARRALEFAPDKALSSASPTIEGVGK